MASRIDCFSDGELTNKFGEELRSQVEERLNFYESGEAPRKNIDVMRKVMDQLPKPEGAEEAAPETPKSDKKKKKKKAKRTADEADSTEGTPKSEKKKAKKAKEAVREEGEGWGRGGGGTAMLHASLESIGQHVHALFPLRLV